MSYLSEAHTDWHTANGKFATCPLDCGANEPIQSECSCGEMVYIFPSDPNDPSRGCVDPAACDVVNAALAATYAAQREAEKAAAADNPWASAPEPPF
jgi:hypothetical protein